VSGVAYGGWLYSLYAAGNFERLGHLGFSVMANGTIMFRVLALSGSLMAWRSMYQAVKGVTAQLMQRFGETIREWGNEAAT
jgi:hypothetical protein